MIKTTNLSKHFQNETAIDYRDLVFEDGKSYMLLGASGCGKSTLLNMIAGILSPESGSIEINGEEMSSKSQKEKDKFRINKIGYIFQDFKLIPEMTVIDTSIFSSSSVLTLRLPTRFSTLSVFLTRRIKRSSIFRAESDRELRLRVRSSKSPTSFSRTSRRETSTSRSARLLSSSL